ncbi:unnamed protein product [Closterium sp. Naga37s-1]|nr:unnamed protein product [Closterium sp. Naga37s-1]
MIGGAPVASGDAANELLEATFGDEADDGLPPERYDFDRAQASSTDVFTTWGIQPAIGFSDPLCATHTANPAAIGGDSAQRTGTPRLGLESASAGDATAEQQHESQGGGGGVGVAVGDIAGAGAILNGDTIAKGDSAGEQQRGIPGVGVAVGGIYATSIVSASEDAVATGDAAAMGDPAAIAEANELPSGGATAPSELPQDLLEARQLLELFRVMKVEQEAQFEGLSLARYGFYEENDRTQASCADVLTALGIQPASEQQHESQDAGVGVPLELVMAVRD